VAQAPKLAPHIDAMRQRIAEALGVAPAQVNVKAKTAEKLGPVGRAEHRGAGGGACCWCGPAA
jgi:2-C-methyl-D-erythritol 2,4-cyclodiphosphate synthase